MHTQLTLFSINKKEEKKEPKKNIIGSREYRKVKILTPKSCTNLYIYRHDLLCNEYKECNQFFFKNQSDRNLYIEELNEIFGKSNTGNNLAGYYPSNLYDKGKMYFGIKQSQEGNIYKI